MNTGKISIIIPTYNRRETLLRCLEYVYAIEGTPFSVVVVFDGCVDGSQAAVKERFSDAIQVEGDGSLWWSGAINAGIMMAQKVGASYYLLLNDDVQPSPDMLKEILSAAESHPDSIIGSLIYSVSAENQPQIWCVGGWTNWLGRGAYMRESIKSVSIGGNDLIQARWLPGMGTLIPASVIERIGMMDAKAFPQYFGDTDFTLRAWRAGIPIYVCPRAFLYNDVQLTGYLLPSGAIAWSSVKTLLFSQKSHSNLKARFRFWRRHCPRLLIPWQATRFYVPLTAVVVKKLTLNRILSLTIRKRNTSDFSAEENTTL